MADTNTLTKVLTALVDAGATPRQLGAVAAALGRANQHPPGFAARPLSAVQRRTADVQCALEVQELLERHGVPHCHHFSEAVALARQSGVLDRTAGQAARRIGRRANHARHSAFYPAKPPGTFHALRHSVDSGDDSVGSVIGLDVMDWYVDQEPPPPAEDADAAASPGATTELSGSATPPPSSAEDEPQCEPCGCAVLPPPLGDEPFFTLFMLNHKAEIHHRLLLSPVSQVVVRLRHHPSVTPTPRPFRV